MAIEDIRLAFDLYKTAVPCAYPKSNHMGSGLQQGPNTQNGIFPVMQFTATFADALNGVLYLASVEPASVLGRRMLWP